MSGESYGPCAICGADALRFAFRARGFEEIRCARCGVFHYWPLPTPRELDALYSDAWAAGGRHFQSYTDPNVEALNIRNNFEPRLALLAKQGIAGRVLDVGCSVGTFLKTAKARGWDAEGLDLGEAACAMAAEATGCRVHCGTLETVSLPGESYHAIHASQVLEHVLSPKDFVAAAWRLLKPGGGLLIATPIIDPIVYRMTWPLQRAVFALGKSKTAVPFPWGINHPYHIFIHSSRSLSLLLRQQGFSIVYVRRFPWNMWYGMNRKWRMYYHVVNAALAVMRSGQNIDILAIKNTGT